MHSEGSRDRRDATALLTSRPFLLAVALLLLNDWVLKAAFGNWLTGKLSDFAGLFAFALFWLALFPKHRITVLALVATVFAAWKSPLAEAPLTLWNSSGIWPLQRVVDMTDLMALAVLVPAYRFAGRPVGARRATAAPMRRRIGAAVAATIAVLAFMGTSVPTPTYPLHDTEGYVVPMAPDEIPGRLDSLGLHVIDYRVPSRKKKEPVERLMIYIRHPPERHVGVEVRVREEEPSGSRITLLSVSPMGAPEPSHDLVLRAFREQVIEPLRQWRSTPAPEP